MDSSSIAILVLVVLGGIFSVVAIVIALRSERLEKRGRLASGVITELIREQSRDADGFLQIYYHPVFQFEDQNGSTHLVKSSIGTNPTGFSVGQTVRVLYDPEKTSLASIDTFGQMWAIPLVFGVIGPAMLIAAGITWWKHSH
jgi:hypothetical protein